MISSILEASLQASGMSLDSLRVGEQIRINHVDCPAGRDTKARLYIKRTAHSVQWYCHNEGDGGCITSGTVDSIKYDYANTFLATDLVTKIQPSTMTIAEQIAPVFWPTDKGFPEDAQRYLAKYLGVNALHIAAEAGIRWSVQYSGIVYPMRDGVQIRRLYPHYTGPKYITLRGMDNELQAVDTRRDDYPLVYVLTEDYLSAVKVSQVPNHRGVPLYGVHIGLATLNRFVRSISRDATIIVWLDNDNATVQNKARGIGNDLSLLCTGINESLVCWATVEPKNMLMPRLLDTLKGLTDATRTAFITEHQ